MMVIPDLTNHIQKDENKMDKYDDLISKSQFFKNFHRKEETFNSGPKLNIGSGPNVFPFTGWINYDREDITQYLDYIKKAPLDGMPIRQQQLANYLKSGGLIDFKVQDLNNKFPQHSNNSVEAIYLGQMIEHLNPLYEVPAFLLECHRMLKIGGVLRITTPDLDLLIQAYLHNQMDKFVKEQPEFYKQADPGSQLAYIMYGSAGPNCRWNNYEGHFFLYTQKSMTTALQKAGFKNIEFYYEPGKSKDLVMAKEAIDEGLSHSFIVEAVK